jgi:rubrerythrin
MASCNHSTLELLQSRTRTVRCRQCHLTLDGEELGDGHCPECFEKSGRRHYDFEEVDAAGDGSVAYRCEECGVIVKCP